MRRSTTNRSLGTHPQITNWSMKESVQLLNYSDDIIVCDKITMKHIAIVFNDHL
jgi:hypothetical protein